MHRLIPFLCLVVCGLGCGGTRMSDTRRSATEQLLLSAAVDQAINNIDVSWFAGKDVYFEDKYLDVAGSPLTTSKDEPSYVASELRQHLLAAGCNLKSDRNEADYVIEARAGAIGTDRSDLLFGAPAMNVPFAGDGSAPVQTPELALAKSSNQQGVAKIALFAYDRHTGQGVWQSGFEPVRTTGKDTWVLGAGPFQRGTIYDRTNFAGSRWIFSKSPPPMEAVKPEVPVVAEAVFDDRALAKRAAKVEAPRQAEAPPPPGTPAPR
jgi:hypothetical protein